MRHFDTIVVGTGGMGSAALHHLAARGARVLGIDRFPCAHDRGSSHGHTRLIRLAYFEHPDYVPLLRRAYELWRELEQKSGRPLLVESGLVTAGPPAGHVVAGLLASAATHSLPVERLSVPEAARRYPGLRLAEDWEIAFEACAGYLFVEECVRAHTLLAVNAGAELEYGAAVRRWRADAAGVVVETDRESFSAGSLVLTSGAWTSDLLQVPGLRLEVLRKALFWYRPEPSRAMLYAAGTLPCFAFDTPAGFFYGFPSLDNRGVKVAEHTGGRPVSDPLSLDRTLDRQEQARVEEVIASHLPGLGREMSSHAHCLYTMSPDGHFALGLHPEHSRVTIAAGFSGHGFKFASVIGEVLADLALSGTTRHPLGFLSPQRFSRQNV